MWNVIEESNNLIPPTIKDALTSLGYDSFGALASLDEDDIKEVEKHLGAAILPGHKKSIKNLAKFLIDNKPSVLSKVQSKINKSKRTGKQSTEESPEDSSACSPNIALKENELENELHTLLINSVFDGIAKDKVQFPKVIVENNSIKIASTECPLCEKTIIIQTKELANNKIKWITQNLKKHLTLCTGKYLAKTKSLENQPLITNLFSSLSKNQ